MISSVHAALPSHSQNKAIQAAATFIRLTYVFDDYGKAYEMLHPTVKKNLSFVEFERHSRKEDVDGSIYTISHVQVSLVSETVVVYIGRSDGYYVDLYLKIILVGSEGEGYKIGSYIASRNELLPKKIYSEIVIK